MSGAVGMKQPAFDQMVAQYAAASGHVEQCAQALQWELSLGNLPVAPAVRLRGMVAQMNAEARDLRRRQAILHHLQATTYNVPQWTPTGTLWDLPDDISALQAGMDGGRAAELAKRAAKGDTKALSELQKYGSEAGDPHFAKALLLGLGAKGVVELPAALARKLQGDMVAGDAGKLGEDRTLSVSALKLLSKALAVGTAPGNMDPDTVFLQQLKAEGRAEHSFPGGGGTYKGYQSLSTVLGMSDGHPPFSRQFMQTIGRDMIDFDRAGPKLKSPLVVIGQPYTPPTQTGPLPDLGGLLHLGWLLTPDKYAPGAQQKAPFGGRTDYLNNLMHAAAFSKEASQALLKGNLTYLLRGRRSKWGQTDHGITFGRAMKVAMSDHDKASMALFDEARQALGQEIRAHVKPFGDHQLKLVNKEELEQISGVRSAFADISTAQLDEIDGILAASDMSGGHPSVASRARDYDALLAFVSMDDEGFRALMNAQLARTRIALDHQFARRGGVDATLLDRMRTLGHLLAVRKEMLAAVYDHDLKKAEAHNEQFKSLVEKGIGYVPVPYASLLGKGVKEGYEEAMKYGYGKVGDWLAKQGEMAPPPGDKGEKYSKDSDAASALMSQMLLSTSAEHFLQLPGVREKDLVGQPFASGHPPKVTPPSTWDPEALKAFTQFCELHNVPVAKFGEDSATAVNNAHLRAIGSFADPKG